MKFAIIGAGAIGGYLGAKLALVGDEITFLVRGANLQAIRLHGIKLVAADGSEQVALDVRATNDYRAAGVHDVVVLAMKAHQLDAVADDVRHLCGPHTVIVPMQNGIPYWYYEYAGRHLESPRVLGTQRNGPRAPSRQRTVAVRSGSGGRYYR